jgi:beta-glucosidase
MKYIIICVFGILLVGHARAQKQTEASINLKIGSIIKKMTLEEKIAMLHGNGLFSSAGIPRLGIPDLTSDDGPLGIREELMHSDWKSANWTTDSATFLPNGSAIAASWNPALAYKYGVVLGEEANARNKTVMLSPAFNICRVPVNGRTYEYYSEDPYLNAQLAVQAVKGIQSQHVAACIKHYAVNNQEVNRSSVNAVVDERALREIYLPAFKAAIQEGNAYTIMSAYNKVNGYWCSENDTLLNQILKKEWGFKGAVISDWGGVHHTVEAANNGLDIEMGTKGPYEQWYFAQPLLAAVKAGKVSEKVIDDKVRRILWVIFHTSMSTNKPKGSIATPAHSKAAYGIASESIVLLKNDRNLLPLKASDIGSIAVIGDNATRTFAMGGYGAGVKAKYEITALAGIKAKLGKTVNIQFAQGYQVPKGKAADNADGKPDQDLIDQAVALAKTTDVAMVCIGSNREYESENHDRKDLELPYGEQALVSAVTAANANTIVVIMAGAPYDLNEIKKNNHTIVWSWFNGSEAGNALADMLTGVINPSGKLPFTFPVNLKDSPAFALNTYPGEDMIANYKEGILVGYRWYDTKKIEPLYSFGYGLSYTSFQYSGIHVVRGKQSAQVSFTLKNTGKISGAEVVQLYVKDDHSSVMRPEKELKAFKKVYLKPGQSQRIILSLNADAFKYYSETKKAWVFEPGKFEVLVGAASNDIKLKGNLVL